MPLLHTSRYLSLGKRVRWYEGQAAKLPEEDSQGNIVTSDHEHINWQMSKLGVLRTYSRVKIQIWKPDLGGLKCDRSGHACPAPTDYLMVHVHMNRRLSIHFHLPTVSPPPSD
jgi:hypothetical protein